ncbi:MAG TPA: hypothetical protein VGA45_01435, partial [Actinomycetota bacterium]
MGSLLHDPSVFHDQDAVGIGDRAQPVGDHDPRAAERAEVAVHHAFGDAVEIARGLVEQQDGGAVGQGAGEGDPLL